MSKPVNCSNCKTFSHPFGHCTACGVKLCAKCYNQSVTRCVGCGAMNKVKRG
jgi:hypothetical protein